MKQPPEPDDAELERQLRESRLGESAPEYLVQRAFTLWQPRPGSAPSPLQRLVALLSFDSGWGPLPAAGVRAAATRHRQVLFSVGEHDLDLRIRPHAETGFVLSGQLLGPKSEGGLTLYLDGTQGQRVDLDALGEFTFQPVPEGECRLVLHLPSGNHAMPPVTLAKP